MQVRGISPNKEKQLMIFKHDQNGKIVVYTEANGYKKLKKEEYQNIRKNPISSDYLLLRKNSKDPDLKNLSMKDQLAAILIENEILKLLTNGRINLCKTASVPKTALHLFYSFKPPVPEKITEQETDFFESCKTGTFRYCKKQYKGKGYKYDFCSEYPSIMRSQSMQFPIGKGELKSLTNTDIMDWKYYKYGIYRVKIANIDKRLLVENSKNYYTHIDINRALELKYDVELIVDDKPNALLYEGKLINGAKLFKEFIDYLFEFKNAKFGCVKKYINCLWGTLCQTDIFTVNTKESPTIKEGKTVLTMLPVGNGEDIEGFMMDVCNKEHLYENDYARIKPFLAAKARYNISKVIEKNVDNLVYSHTDSVILTEEIKDVKLGSNIGDLKFEEYAENIEVKNKNTVIGFTKTQKDLITTLNKELEMADDYRPTTIKYTKDVKMSTKFKTASIELFE